jgi:MFS family permease
MALLFVGGMCFMALFSISFSLVQMTVPEGLRGRVVSIYMVALRGGGPLGALVAGALADRFSAADVMTVNSVALALFTLLIVIFRRARSLTTA